MAKQDIYAPRRARLVRKFGRAGVDGLLVTSEVNVRYLTGFRGGDSALLVTREKTVLVTDSRYDEQAADETRGLEIVVRKKGLMTASARTARRLDLARLGVEAGNLALAAWDALRKDLGPAKAVRTNGLVGELRLIKDRHEIALTEAAAEIAQEAFKATVARIGPGMTERAIARMLDQAMTERGAEAPAFPTIVAAGPRSSLPHAIPGDRKVKRGDAVLFDWGARREGYHSDLTRLVFFDRISPLFRRLYEAVLGAQRRAIAGLRPGRCAGKIDATARAVLKAHRHNKHFTHGLGHGLGLQVHEAPTLSARSDTILKPGMVVTVEPGVYLPGRGGVRIEDDVLVTRTGHRMLTSLPKSLESFLIRSP